MTVYVDNFCGDELLWPDQDRCGAECGGTFDRFHLAGQCGRERTERAQPQANLHFCSIKVASPRQTDHKLHVHPPGPNVRASHYHKYSVRNSTSYRRRINTPLITEKLVPHRRRVPHIPMPTQQNKSYRVQPQIQCPPNTSRELRPIPLAASHHLSTIIRCTLSFESQYLFVYLFLLSLLFSRIFSRFYNTENFLLDLV